MIKVKNTLENKVIFEGNTREFLVFVEKIAKENGDENWSFLGYSDGEEYITEYCENLQIID